MSCRLCKEIAVKFQYRSRYVDVKCGMCSSCWAHPVVASQSMDVSRETLDTLVAREVPVEWYGVASQVGRQPLPQ